MLHKLHMEKGKVKFLESLERAANDSDPAIGTGVKHHQSVEMHSLCRVASGQTEHGIC